MAGNLGLGDSFLERCWELSWGWFDGLMVWLLAVVEESWGGGRC